MAPGTKAKLYTRYPLASVITYDGTTILHFLLGGGGIALGFGSPAGYGSLYLVFAFAEMYLIMPLKVCPNCVYYRLDDALCVSGLNIVSKRVAGEGDPRMFLGRARGPLCPNNLYLAALFVPIVAVVAALAVDFSVPVLAVLLALAALLVLRFLVLIPRMACVHCRAKHVCPQAGAMGVRDK